MLFIVVILIVTRLNITTKLMSYMCRDVTKGTVHRENQNSVLHIIFQRTFRRSFWYKNKASSTIFDGVISNSVIQNTHYEKLNLLRKLISKFYI